MTTSTDTDGLVERNPWEVANQLVGYIDTSAPTDLAGFLLRESNEAAKMARAIEAQAARIAELEGALERQWQPMDTAPTDGTPLLLFARCKTATTPVVLIGWHIPDQGWIESSFTNPVGIVPLAWQPRPAFPSRVG